MLSLSAVFGLQVNRMPSLEQEQEHARKYLGIEYKIWWENLKGWVHLRDLDIDGMMILE
jgi:hypothetical protein